MPSCCSKYHAVNKSLTMAHQMIFYRQISRILYGYICIISSKVGPRIGKTKQKQVLPAVDDDGGGPAQCERTKIIITDRNNIICLFRRRCSATTTIDCLSIRIINTSSRSDVSLSQTFFGTPAHPAIIYQTPLRRRSHCAQIVKQYFTICKI